MQCAFMIIQMRGMFRLGVQSFTGSPVCVPVVFARLWLIPPPKRRVVGAVLFNAC